MSKYKHMNYNDILGLFKTGREFLEWIKEGDWAGQLDNLTCEEYFHSIKQAVNPISYDVPIPDETMCEALERTLQTGEMIDIEPDPEFLVPPPEQRQLDGWTYHIKFISQESYFQVETPPCPPE